MVRIHVLVHLKPDVLDVQGQAITGALQVAGHGAVKSVRQGKSFQLELEGDSVDALRDEIERLCQETLSNPTMETYAWEEVES